jgi:hypothetical protein
MQGKEILESMKILAFPSHQISTNAFNPKLLPNIIKNNSFW